MPLPELIFTGVCIGTFVFLFYRLIKNLFNNLK